MWDKIGEGLKKVAGVLPLAVDVGAGVIPQAMQGRMPQWLFPLRHLVGLFKKNKPKDAELVKDPNDRVTAAPYGEELTSPEDPPIAAATRPRIVQTPPQQPGGGQDVPQKQQPVAQEKKRPSFSVSFSAPEQNTSMPEPLPIDNTGMLQLHPFRMNRRRRMQKATPYDEV